MIQAVQALTDLFQHILNMCALLDYVTVMKFDMLQ